MEIRNADTQRTIAPSLAAVSQAKARKRSSRTLRELDAHGPARLWVVADGVKGRSKQQTALPARHRTRARGTHAVRARGLRQHADLSRLHAPAPSRRSLSARQGPLPLWPR